MNKAVMRKLDTLVTEFTNVYKFINETEYGRIYEMQTQQILNICNKQ
jgi:hypothetical protein